MRYSIHAGAISTNVSDVSASVRFSFNLEGVDYYNVVLREVSGNVDEIRIPATGVNEV